MSISTVQGTSARIAAPTLTHECSWPSDTTPGSYLLAAYAVNVAGGATITTGLDAAGWSLIGSRTLAGGVALYVYAIETAASRPSDTPEVVTLSVAAEGAIFLYELSGTPASGVIDASVFSQSATGNTRSYYVSPTAAFLGGTAGTTAYAAATSTGAACSFNDAKNNWQAGDEVILLDGIYPVTGSLSLDVGGSAGGGYVTIRSQTLHGAVFQVQGSFNGDIIQVTSNGTGDYLRFLGIGIDGQNALYGSGTQSNIGIHVKGTHHHIHVEACRIHHCNGNGIELEDVDYFSILDNDVWLCGHPSGTAGSGISVRFSATPTIQDVYDGFHNFVCGNRVAGSEGEITDGNGIILDNGNVTTPKTMGSTLVFGNLVYHNANRGIHNLGMQGRDGVGILIANNTTYKQGLDMLAQSPPQGLSGEFDIARGAATYRNNIAIPYHPGVSTYGTVPFKDDFVGTSVPDLDAHNWYTTGRSTGLIAGATLLASDPFVGAPQPPPNPSASYQGHLSAPDPATIGTVFDAPASLANAGVDLTTLAALNANQVADLRTILARYATTGLTPGWLSAYRTASAASTQLASIITSGTLTPTQANELVVTFAATTNTPLQAATDPTLVAPLATSGGAGDPVPATSVPLDPAGVSLGVWTILDSRRVGGYSTSVTLPTTSNWVAGGVTIKDANGSSVSLGAIHPTIHVAAELASLVLGGANSAPITRNEGVWTWPEALSGETSQPPLVTLGAAASVTSASAVLTATVDPEGQATSVAFDYTHVLDATGNPDWSQAVTVAYPTIIPAGYGLDPVVQAITSLAASTTYYFRCRAQNASGETTSSVASFATDSSTPTGGAPIVTLPAVGGVTTTSGVFTATVDPDGAVTTWHVEYGPSGAGFPSRTPDVPLAQISGAQDVSVTLAGLAAGVTYQARLVATNAFGATTSSVVSFATTIILASVTAVLDAATSLAQTSVTLNGHFTLSPGTETSVPITAFFEWGATTSYGQQTTTQSFTLAPGATQAVSATLTGLAPGTTYHYALVAARSDAASTSTSVDAAVTTQAASGGGGANDPDSPLFDPGGYNTWAAKFEGKGAFAPDAAAIPAATRTMVGTPGGPNLDLTVNPAPRSSDGRRIYMSDGSSVPNACCPFHATGDIPATGLSANQTLTMLDGTTYTTYAATSSAVWSVDGAPLKDRTIRTNPDASQEDVTGHIVLHGVAVTNGSILAVGATPTDPTDLSGNMRFAPSNVQYVNQAQYLNADLVTYGPASPVAMSGATAGRGVLSGVTLDQTANLFQYWYCHLKARNHHSFFQGAGASGTSWWKLTPSSTGAGKTDYARTGSITLSVTTNLGTATTPAITAPLTAQAIHDALNTLTSVIAPGEEFRVVGHDNQGPWAVMYTADPDTAVTDAKLTSVVVTTNTLKDSTNASVTLTPAQAAAPYGVHGNVMAIHGCTGDYTRFHHERRMGDGSKLGGGSQDFQYSYFTDTLHPERFQYTAAAGHIDGIQVIGANKATKTSPAVPQGCDNSRTGRPLAYAGFFMNTGNSSLYCDGLSTSTNVGLYLDRCLLIGVNKGVAINGSDRCGSVRSYYALANDTWYPTRNSSDPAAPKDARWASIVDNGKQLWSASYLSYGGDSIDVIGNGATDGVSTFTLTLLTANNQALTTAPITWSATNATLQTRIQSAIAAILPAAPNPDSVLAPVVVGAAGTNGWQAGITFGASGKEAVRTITWTGPVNVAATNPRPTNTVWPDDPSPRANKSVTAAGAYTTITPNTGTFTTGTAPPVAPMTDGAYGRKTAGYQIPATATLASTSTLVTLLSGTTPLDIKLPAGTYTNSAPVTLGAAHRLWAASSGGTVTLGFGLNADAQPGVQIHGVTINLASAAKGVPVAGQTTAILAGRGCIITDCVFTLASVVDFAIASNVDATSVIVERVSISGAKTGGVNLPGSFPGITQLDHLQDIDYTGPGVGVSLGVAATGMIRRIRTRGAQTGLVLGGALHETHFEDIDADSTLASAVGVEIAQYVGAANAGITGYTGCTFTRARLGPNLATGWKSDPATGAGGASTISVDRASNAGTAQTRFVAHHMQNSLRGKPNGSTNHNETAIQTAEQLCADLFYGQATHLAGSAWQLIDQNPSAGAYAYTGAATGQRASKAWTASDQSRTVWQTWREVEAKASQGAERVLIVHGCETWKQDAAHAASDETYPPAPTHIQDTATAALDYAIQAKAAGVPLTHISVWNELKGLTRVWQPADFASTPGGTTAPTTNWWDAPMWYYTTLYNAVYDTIKGYTADPSIQAIKVGGPHMNFGATTTEQDHLFPLGNDSGSITAVQFDHDFFVYWLQKSHGFDFVSIDYAIVNFGSDADATPAYIKANAGSFGTLIRRVQNLQATTTGLTSAERAAPIYVIEGYYDSKLSRCAANYTYQQQALFEGLVLREVYAAGVARFFKWQPMGDSNNTFNGAFLAQAAYFRSTQIAGATTDSETGLAASGGAKYPAYDVAKLFLAAFPAGTTLCNATSTDTDLVVIASATKTLVLNQNLTTAKTFTLDGQSHTLAAASAAVYDAVTSGSSQNPAGWHNTLTRSWIAATTTSVLLDDATQYQALTRTRFEGTPSSAVIRDRGGAWVWGQAYSAFTRPASGAQSTTILANNTGGTVTYG